MSQIDIYQHFIHTPKTTSSFQHPVNPSLKYHILGPKLTKIQKQKNQINKIAGEKRYITTYTEEIQRILDKNLKIQIPLN